MLILLFYMLVLTFLIAGQRSTEYYNTGWWWRRALQQKLRMHRSLKSYCATLVMKTKRKMISVLIFPSNGAQVE
jgi:hypothetical protein